MRLRNALAALIAAMHLVVVTFLYDKKHAIAFSVLVPLVLWFVAVADYIDKTELLPKSALNVTSVTTIVAVGLYTHSLTSNYSRNWIMGWFTLCVCIFVDVVFKFQYEKPYPYLYFVFQTAVFLFGIRLLSYTSFIPWDAVWVALVPIVSYFAVIAFGSHAKNNSGTILVYKAILGAFAVICCVYIGAFAYHGESVPCELDAECPHGSTRHGTGAKINHKCNCINSQWYRTYNFDICLPCNTAVDSATDCCGNNLTFENVKTLKCGSTRDLFSCVQ